MTLSNILSINKGKYYIIYMCGTCGTWYMCTYYILYLFIYYQIYEGKRAKGDLYFQKHEPSMVV
jgi:hypothetical protein